jgi:hypothetical protein
MRVLYTKASSQPQPTLIRTSVNCPNLDLDVLQFIDATNINDPVIEIALNVFVTTLKANNMWNKFDAIYPFVGNGHFPHKFNLKNPLDSDSAFRLNFVGGWTHNSNGVTPNGFNTSADTYYNELVHSSLNNKHISIYSRTNASGLLCDMGVFDGSSISTDIIPRYNSAGEKCFVRNSSGTGSFNNTDSRGFFLNNRVSSTEIRSYKNATLNILTATSTSLLNGSYFIGATNNYLAGTIPFRSIRNLAFASIGEGFTDGEAVILYNAVQALQTALSRQV